MILYDGTKTWNYCRRLKDMVVIPKGLERYFSDYEIKNLFDVAFLKPEQVKMSESDFGIVADYFTDAYESSVSAG